MQELFEEILQYLRGIWLKRRYILISTWILCPLGWLFVSSLPNQYMSEAKVFADTRSILKPLLHGMAIQTDPKKELALIVKTLTTRENLDKIARAADADLATSSKAEYDELLKYIKRGLDIEPSLRDNIYTLSFEGNDPVQAKRLVDGAISVFIENTLGEKRLDSDQAQRFLDEQIAEYERRLSEDERRLAEFKKKYAPYMVKNQGGYYSALEASKSQLEQAELELQEIQTELASARDQLEGEIAAQDPDMMDTKFDERIESLQLRLDDISVRFTDFHPEVVETRRLLETLQKQKADYLAGRSGTGDVDGNSYYRDLKATVSKLENKVASLEVRKAKFQSEVEELQSRLDQVPDVQAKLTGLNRTYNITKDKYYELLSRKESAEMSEKVDQSTESISFRLLEPAELSLKPSGPPRIIFLILVLILSVGVGIGLSLIMSILSPVVTSPKQLMKLTDLPVWGMVSATDNSGMQKWEKRKAIIFVAANLALLGLFAAFIAVNANSSWHEMIFVNGLGAL